MKQDCLSLSWQQEEVCLACPCRLAWCAAGMSSSWQQLSWQEEEEFVLHHPVAWHGVWAVHGVPVQLL